MARRRTGVLLAAFTLTAGVGLGLVAQAGSADQPKGRTTGVTNDALPGEPPVTYAINDGYANDLPTDTAYAREIKGALGGEDVHLERVTTTRFDGKESISDQINQNVETGFGGAIYHNCNLFLEERSEDKPTFERPDGKVWVGVMNDQMVTLSLYNAKTHVPVWVRFTSSAGSKPISIEKLIDSAKQLSSSPAVVAEVGGNCS